MVEEHAVLAVDVGGSHVKVLVNGESESRRAPSGPTLTPSQMVRAALGAAEGWRELPPGTRLGSNSNAFTGGFRLWQQSPSPTTPAAATEKETATPRGVR